MTLSHSDPSGEWRPQPVTAEEIMRQPGIRIYRCVDLLILVTEHMASLWHMHEDKSMTLVDGFWPVTGPDNG